MDKTLTFQKALNAEIAELQTLFNKLLEYHQHCFENHGGYKEVRDKIAAREKSIDALKAMWQKADELVNGLKI